MTHVLYDAQQSASQYTHGGDHVSFCIIVYQLVVDTEGLDFHSLPVDNDHSQMLTSAWLPSAGWKVYDSVNSPVISVIFGGKIGKCCVPAGGSGLL